MFERFWALSLDVFTVVGFDGLLIAANPAFEKVLGYPVAESIGRPIFEQVEPDDVAETQVGFAAFARGASMISFENRVRARDGGVRWMEWAAYPFLAEDRAYCVGRDVTDRQADLARMRTLAAIVEGSDDAIVAESLDGTITAWNPGAERLYDYTADEAIGQNYARLVPEGREEELTGLLARVQADESVPPYETERVGKDGRRISVMVRVSPVRDENGRITGASSIGRDLTAFKASEAARLELLVAERLARQETDVFATVGARLAQSRDDLSETLWVVADSARNLLGGAAGGIATPIAEGVLQVVAVAGENVDALRGLILRPGTGMAARSLASGRPMQVEDYLTAQEIEHDPVLDEALRSVHARSMLAVPINGEHLEGVLYAAHRQPHRFSASEIARAQRLADLAATAIRTARLRTREREERSQLLVAERRDAMLSLTRRYEQKQIEGIGIQTEPGVCRTCQTAASDVYMPALAPTLPLVGCTSTEGCRCRYVAPAYDPRRRPPPVPADRATNLTIPGGLRDAARFGSNPRGNCRSGDLVEYLESYPLLPYVTDTPLNSGEVVYLERAVRHGWETPGAGARPGLTVPFNRVWRDWVENVHGAVKLPDGVAPRRESSRLMLTSWRLMFEGKDGVASILLADVTRLEYYRNALACTVGERPSRLVFFVDDALQVGLYIARAIWDIAVAARPAC